MDYRNELEKAMEHAKSYTGLRPPEKAEYIGSIDKQVAVFNFYKDENGNYYYDTDRARAFEMELAKKRKRPA